MVGIWLLLIAGLIEDDGDDALTFEEPSHFDATGRNRLQGIVAIAEDVCSAQRTIVIPAVCEYSRGIDVGVPRHREHAALHVATEYCHCRCSCPKNSCPF